MRIYEPPTWTEVISERRLVVVSRMLACIAFLIGIVWGYLTSWSKPIPGWVVVLSGGLLLGDIILGAVIRRWL